MLMILSGYWANIVRWLSTILSGEKGSIRFPPRQRTAYYLFRTRTSIYVDREESKKTVSFRNSQSSATRLTGQHWGVPARLQLDRVSSIQMYFYVLWSLYRGPFECALFEVRPDRITPCYPDSNMDSTVRSMDRPNTNRIWIRGTAHAPVDFMSLTSPINNHIT